MLAVLACVRPLTANAAQLAAIRLDTLPNGSTRVVLTFEGAPPPFRLVPQGPLELAVNLPATDAASGIPLTTAGSGSITRVRFVQLTGGAAQVILRLAAPVQTRASADAHSIFIDAASIAPSGPAGAPPPQAMAPGAGAVVIPLKFADVSEIVGILVAGQSIPPNDNFTPQPSQIGSPAGLSNGFGGGNSSFGGANLTQAPFGGTAYQGGAGGQPVSLGQRITENIAIDRRLNAIVLSGPPALVAQLRALIEQLDIQLPSVILETEIVELTDNAAADLGIDYTNGTQGQIANGQLQIKSGGPPAGTATLQAAIYAAIAKGGGRLLAKPRIVAQNGGSASILTGDAIPIVTNITSFAAATTVTQQVNYVTVGVNLQIQPRISSDGFVTSHVFSEVSSVTGYTQGFPQISQRIATTAATVRDGESFVIGGLVQDAELRSMQKIPGIGDIPVLGQLFRVRHDSDSATNLYIVVTPRVVQPGTSQGTFPPITPAPIATPAPI